MKLESEPFSIEDRSDWSLGEVLQWHLNHGTRPKSSGKPYGEIWTIEEFVEAVGSDQRNVENWLANRSVPTKKAKPRILMALCGSDAERHEDRRELMMKLGLGPRERKESRHPDDQHDPGTQRNSSGDIRSSTHGIAKVALVLAPDMPRYRLELVGRERELADIDVSLAKPAQQLAGALARAVAIVGLPGLGKTALALAYARSFVENRGRVWWCLAESRNTLLASLGHLAAHLMPNTALEPSSEAAAYRTFRELADQPEEWLIVYDNAALPSEIEDLLPPAAVKLLITSRHHAWRDWSQKFDLGLLTPQAAVDLLLRQSGRKNQEGASHLAGVLGYLPLALTHAARFCEVRPSLSFVEYADRAAAMMKVAPPGHPYPREVHATFTIAIEEVVALAGSVAEHVLAIISYCAPDRIPEALVTSSFAEDINVSRVFLFLTEVSLIQSEASPEGCGEISIHRLVQEAARERATRKGLSKWAVEQIALWLCDRLSPKHPEANDASSPDTWQPFVELASLVMALMRSNLVPKHPNWPLVLFRMGEHFLARCENHLAEYFYAKALERDEAIHGTHHRVLARDLFQLAHAKRLVGEPAAAKQLLQRALGIALAHGQAERLLLGSILCELGRLQANDGDITGARKQVDHALRIFKAAGPNAAISVAGALTLLGGLAADEDNWREALERQKEAISALGSQAERYTLWVHIMRSNLGWYYYKSDDLPRASEELVPALEFLLEKLGAQHPEVIRIAHHLGEVRAEQGQMQDACNLYRWAVEQCDEAASPYGESACIDRTDRRKAPSWVDRLSRSRCAS